MGEDVLGPAVALTALKPTEPCVVVRDCTGALFVRAVSDDDALPMLLDDGGDWPL